MTVRELKELLSQYPDYYPVMIRLVDAAPGDPDGVAIARASVYQAHVLIEPTVAVDYFDTLR